MSVFEAVAIAISIYAAVLVWLLVDVVRVHVATQKFLLQRAKDRSKPAPAIPVRRAVRL